MVTKSLVEVPFSVHGLIFIESVRGPWEVSFTLAWLEHWVRVWSHQDPSVSPHGATG